MDPARIDRFAAYTWIPRAKPARRRGGRHGARIPHDVEHAIAEALLASLCPHCLCVSRTRREIAEEHGVTYEQVRTVGRDLEALSFVAMRERIAYLETQTGGNTNG